MAITPQGEKHLRWCADRAILELNAGSARNALASVLSDFSKSDTTAGIDRGLVMMIVEPATRESPEALEKAIMDFNV